MDEPSVTACLDGTFRDIGVIDVARRRALVRDASIRLVTVADPEGVGVELAPAELDSMTSLQVLLRSGELPQPTRVRKARRRRGTAVRGDSSVLAERNYGLLSAVGGNGRQGTLVRVQERWALDSTPPLVGVCITRLRDAGPILRAAGAEVGDEHVSLRVVYASGRLRRNRPLSRRDALEITRELTGMALVPIHVQVVGGDPYRLLTELGHSCRAVVIPGRPAIPQTGPDGWRYPATGCPLVVVPSLDLGVRRESASGSRIPGLQSSN